MHETQTRGFTAARERLQGVRELSDENVDAALREVRGSLLEADVDLAVVKDFLGRVKQRALGENVPTRIRDNSGRQLRLTPLMMVIQAESDISVARRPRWQTEP